MGNKSEISPHPRTVYQQHHPYPTPMVTLSRPIPFGGASHFATEAIQVSYRIDKKLWTVEANTSQTFDYHFVEAHVVHWFCQLNMAEMTGTFTHISSTSLAARIAIDGSLSWIHEATQLRSTTFHCFWVFNASVSRNRHLFLLKKKTKLRYLLIRTTRQHITGHSSTMWS